MYQLSLLSVLLQTILLASTNFIAATETIRRPISEEQWSRRRRQQQEEQDNSIIGGTEAQPGEFPFFVRFSGNILCGGTLISPNRVLTAAHCIYEVGVPEAVFVASSNKDNGQYIPVTCAVVHPKYQTPFVTVLNDVAILKLSKDAVLADGTTATASDSNSTTAAEIVQLNSDSNFPGNVQDPDLTVIGFGKLSNGGSISETLQKVGTNYVPTETCQQSYSDVIVRPVFHICGDVMNKGDCQGDSGGPLLVQSTDTPGQYIQIGIVSFGYGGCAAPEYPDIYTKVSSYYDFIQSHIDDDSCPADTSTLGESNGLGGNIAGVATMAVDYLGLLLTVTKDRIVDFVFFWRN